MHDILVYSQYLHTLIGTYFLKGVSFHCNRVGQTCKIIVMNTFAQHNEIKRWTWPIIHCWFPLAAYYKNEVREFLCHCWQVHKYTLHFIIFFYLAPFWIESRIQLVVCFFCCWQCTCVVYIRNDIKWGLFMISSKLNIDN